jgi:hypothetical protein
MFKNVVLRKLFGPKRDVVTVDWRRRHRGELYDLNCSPNVIWVIKSRRVRGWGMWYMLERGEMNKGS